MTPLNTSRTASTRFSADEYLMLEELAKSESMDPHQALNMCVKNQIAKLDRGSMIARERALENSKQQAAQVQEELRDRMGKDHLESSVMLDSSQHMNNYEMELAREYGQLVGCKSPSGARRHALIAELRDRGIVHPEVEPPLQFSSRGV